MLTHEKMSYKDNSITAKETPKLITFSMHALSSPSHGQWWKKPIVAKAVGPSYFYLVHNGDLTG